MVPLLVISPVIFNVPAADVVTVAPEFIIRFLQFTLLLIVGWFVAVGIITSVAEVGTTPVLQLPAVAQLVLTAPVH
jgi:hypothetical protein